MTGMLDRNDPFVVRVLDRLGVSEAVQTEEQLLAIVDAALEPRTPKPFTPPAGQVLVDQGRYEELIGTIAHTDQLRQQQRHDRAKAIVSNALAEGRIAAFSAEAWIGMAMENEAGTAALLRDFAVNTIPMQELGHTDGPETFAYRDDALYRRLFPGDAA